jgi:hypothetical protein
MISENLQILIKKIILGGEEGKAAFKEYKALRCQSNKPQLEIDNAFLSYLAEQQDTSCCESEALWEATWIYSQNDGYSKPE